MKTVEAVAGVVSVSERLGEAVVQEDVEEGLSNSFECALMFQRMFLPYFAMDYKNTVTYRNRATPRTEPASRGACEGRASRPAHVLGRRFCPRKEFLL